MDLLKEIQILEDKEDKCVITDEEKKRLSYLKWKYTNPAALIDLTGKSLDEIIMYLKEKGYVPCHDTYGMHIGYLACPNDCGGYCEIDIQIKHEKYDISLFECDCDLVFYEIIYKDLDLMPDRWETKDGIMVGLE